MSQKVLIATGEFGESLEVYYCAFRLKEEGVQSFIAAPRRKSLQLVVHDFEPGYDSYTEKLGYRVEADVAYGDVDPAEYDGLIIPGGRAPEEIRSDPDLLRIVRHFLSTDSKPLAAICHGVMLLYTAGDVRGRELTCYSGIRADVELAGAIYLDREVVVSGNVVTSRGWGDLGAFCSSFLKLLR
ncbi:MAG: DJ-1/PfpI family protein [Planctomycetota bacterium]|nr:DJ-1/PfpI family protein [Planctomycetota bacterium]